MKLTPEQDDLLKVWTEVLEAMRKALGDRHTLACLVDTRGGSISCPEVRVSPLGPDHAPFCIVRHADGRRELVDLKPGMLVMPMPALAAGHILAER